MNVLNITANETNRLNTGQQKLVMMVYAAMFAALMAIGANITTFLPFLVVAGVPITLQTFFAILAGLLLGSRGGVLATTLYMALGLIGAPVLAGFKGGPAQLFSPFFGFVVSFIIVAYVVGKISETYPTKVGFVIAATVGTVINYVFGTTWMYYAWKFWAEAPEVFSYKIAWLALVPPMPKDAVLMVVCGLLGYRTAHIKRR
ncbi:biotin transporter BioY [Savagea serpentis]